MLSCPMCGGPLPGLRDTCSDRCRQRKSRADRATRAAKMQDLLHRQTEAIANGADPALVASLAREAQRLLR